MATEIINSPALKITVSETERQDAINLLSQHAYWYDCAGSFKKQV